MRLFSDESSEIRDPFLKRAFDRALRGRGQTSPNPIVGCVIVGADGRIVGEGHHERAGDPHAEINALAEAGSLARGSTAYVTLEPCSHHGKTPPCTDALVAAGVTQVVIGMPDPNPDVAGGGAIVLRAQGIEVRFADDPAPFVALNEQWLNWLETGLPWVRVKTALSMDGHPGRAKGSRTRLTGDAARALTMRLRSYADAVVVGTNTAAVDDPALTVRDLSDKVVGRQPLRVVLGREGIIPNAALFSDGFGSSLALVPDGVPAEIPDGVDVATYRASGGLRAALQALGQREITSVLFEAGPGLLTALWDGRLIDEMVLYHAGGMIGVPSPPAYEGELLSGDSLKTRMVAREAAVLDEDAATVWRRAPSPR